MMKVLDVFLRKKKNFTRYSFKRNLIGSKEQKYSGSKRETQIQGFFHAATSTRKKMNHISRLRNDTRDFFSNHSDMCSIIKSYYSDVFTGSSSMPTQNQISGASVITSKRNEELRAELSFWEFTLAMKQMHLEKASGSGGLNPFFFQHFWQILGREVFVCCKRWFDKCSFPAEINDTNLVLIPKKTNVESPKDLSTIALYNVL